MFPHATTDVSDVVGATSNLALYSLTADSGGFRVEATETKLPFLPSEYSHFKYGRLDITERYGEALADMIVAHLAPLLRVSDQVVVMGTPYKRVPNAARMLAIGAQRHMRRAGIPTSYTCIYQHRLMAGDYSGLSARERELRNRQKKRYIDLDDFAGRHVVLIDDIRVTGSVERSVAALLGDVPMLSMTIANLVHLDPDAARNEPELESKLNHHAMTGLPDLLQLMNRRDQFVLTTRAVKYILESATTDLCWLLGQLDDGQIAALYEAIIDEGYDIMPCYDQSFMHVSNAHR